MQTSPLRRFYTDPWFLLLATLMISIVYWSGIPSVPFHPDESTNIFMSGDLDTLFSQPDQLSWQPNREEDLKQHYRELDAPLDRYLIGIGRKLLANLPPLAVDWDWSKSWQENQVAGALPDLRLLIASRLGVAWLFPISLILLYLTARRLGSPFMAWSTFLLFSSNALILLHTRRAMAESALVFNILFTLWALTRFDRHPWLLAVPVALAFNSKYSSVALIPLGLIAILWPSTKYSFTVIRRLRDAVWFMIMIASITFLLNPFLWKMPVQALRSAIQTRQQLIHNQQTDLARIDPDLVLNTFPERLEGQLVHLYMTRPFIADIGNYLTDTQTVEDAYLANPLHQLLRGMIPGSALLIFSILGFILAIRSSWGWKNITQRHLTLLCIGTLLQFIALGVFFSLPFQRYCLPMVPFSCLWVAYALEKCVQAIRSSSRRKAKRA